MEDIESIQLRIVAAFPAAKVEVLTNSAPSAQHSLLVGAEDLMATARFLRDDPALQLDFCSNVTGVDWLDRTVKVKVRQEATGNEIEEAQQFPGCLEVVYHLYSMARKHGPIVLRVRTKDRSQRVSIPSLTPVWRSCEFQEREIFDLFGVRFEGHPDLRRLLMWDGFKDHPMRKDYVEPDDYEYEPTAHDRILERAKTHANNEVAS